jgi:hypothetical protein
MRPGSRTLYARLRSAADGVGAGFSAFLGRFSRDESVQYRRRAGVRDEQIPRGAAIALLAVPAVCLLVLAVMGIGSAVSVASPQHRSLKSAAAGVDGVSVAGIDASNDGTTGERGFVHAIGTLDPLDPIDEPGAPAAVEPGSSLSTAPAGADLANQPIASAKVALAQAVSPGPSAEINPIPDPVATAAAAAAVTVAAAPKPHGTITIVTFGYAFADPPEGSRFVADVQNVDAGSFLRTETGLMPSVQTRVMATPAAQEWMRVFTTEWMPSLKDGDMVSIGCKRGHHRSVTLGELFAGELRAQGYTVNVVHRDILKTY